ncbi:MAG: bifunctional diguanylate cyclase/phosphodiesterase [Hyphomicrobiaceae bacterium]|nr:bifunctional diguanylate cyclase/phosphodiesterase [Hyphomicrobiaceae bacterium]
MTEQPAPPPAGIDGAAGPGADGGQAVAVDGAPAGASGRFDFAEAMTAANETAYALDIAADRLDWTGNVLQVLGVPSLDAISTEARYRFLIAPEHVGRRLMLGRSGSRGREDGVPYRVQYRLMPRGRSGDVSLRVEDQGRWWADADGYPSRAVGVVRVIDDRYRDEQLLRRRGNQDELTGHLSRRKLIEALSDVVAGSGRENPSAFLMVAINDLSVTNETFGFEAGDEVIAAVGRVLRDELRVGDVIGRYSSNKFGVILRRCGAGAMRMTADRLLTSVRAARINAAACRLSATVSIGGVLVPELAGSANEAIGRSLQALSGAKLKFEGFSAYQPSPQEDSVRLRNIAVTRDVVAALETGRMRLALQPIVSTASWEPVLHECLLRMERADGTMIAAGEFIGIAEQLGLARLVDRRALELAVGILERQPDLRLSLNVSGLTCSDHDWLAALHRLAGGSKLAERLTIEITETAAIRDLDQSAAFVDALKDLGCRVAIDDFGAGNTSFKNLKHLAVDMVKIDGAFVKNLPRDRSDQVFVKAMIELARNLNMETVAEWVGDDATARLLADAGVDYLQGFHFGEPVIVEGATSQ